MMLVRHADAVFWAGRYLERAESTVRFLDVADRSQMELWPDDARIEARQIIRALGLEEEYEEHGGDDDLDAVRRYLLSDALGSIPHAITALRDNLRVVQDRVPVELWEEVNRVHLELRAVVAGEGQHGTPHDLYVSVRRQCQAISGVLSEAMLRDEGHALLVVGRAMERAMLTVHLIATTLTHPDGRFDAERLLRSTSTLQSYRRIRHHADDAEEIVAFLLLEPRVPRTILACLDRIETHLATVEAGRHVLLPVAQRTGLLRARLMYRDVIGEIRSDAVALLTDLQDSLTDLAATAHGAMIPPMDMPVLHSQHVRPGGERAPA